MPKKRIIILSVLTILALIGLPYFAIYFPKIENFYHTESTCGEEGQIIGVAKSPTICCEGLISISGTDFDEDCNIIGFGGLNKCSDCGDNICDTENWENKCNCPKDCK